MCRSVYRNIRMQRKERISNTYCTSRIKSIKSALFFKKQYSKKIIALHQYKQGKKAYR